MEAPEPRSANKDKVLVLNVRGLMTPSISYQTISYQAPTDPDSQEISQFVKV